MPTASIVRHGAATRDGVLYHVDALAVGTAAWRLGAGRARKEDDVSATAGVLLLARPGDAVSRGQPLLELHTEDEAAIPRALDAIKGAFSISDDPYERRPSSSRQ